MSQLHARRETSVAHTSGAARRTGRSAVLGGPTAAISAAVTETERQSLRVSSDGRRGDPGGGNGKGAGGGGGRDAAGSGGKGGDSGDGGKGNGKGGGKGNGKKTHAELAAQPLATFTRDFLIMHYGQ